jgi:predicted phage terminase large subunit-like protein
MDVDFKLANKNQYDFLRAVEPFVGYVGGVGSGKTFILVTKCLLNAMQGRISAIVSFTYTSLRDVVIPTIYEVCGLLKLSLGEHWILNKSEMTLSVCGTTVFLRSSDNIDRLRGLNLHDAYIEEACYHKNLRDLILMMIGRLRLGHNNQLFMGTTPKGFDDAYEFFVVEADGRKLLLQSKTSDNAFLTREYIEALKAEYTGAYFEQEFNAEFVDFSTGLINANHIEIVAKPPDNIVKVFRFYDLAVKDKQHNDFTASCLGGFGADEKFYILNVTNEKAPIDKTQETIINRSDIEKDVIIGIESAGQMEGYIKQIARDERMRSKIVRAVPVEGSKVVRAMIWASKIDSENIKMVRGKWNRDFINQCNSFTQDMTHKHDDMIDAMSGCYCMASKPKTEIRSRVVRSKILR